MKAERLATVWQEIDDLAWLGSRRAVSCKRPVRYCGFLACAPAHIQRRVVTVQPAEDAAADEEDLVALQL